MVAPGSQTTVFRDFGTVPLQQASWEKYMLELLIRCIFYAHFQPCLPPDYFKFFFSKILTPHLGSKEWTDFHQTYTVDPPIWCLPSTGSTTFWAHFPWRNNVLFFSHKKGSVTPMGGRIGPKIGVGAPIIRSNIWPTFSGLSFLGRFYHQDDGNRLWIFDTFQLLYSGPRCQYEPGPIFLTSNRGYFRRRSVHKIKYIVITS